MMIKLGNVVVFFNLLQLDTWLDAGSGGCVGHRLCHAVRLHDFRSIWSQSGLPSKGYQ